MSRFGMRRIPELIALTARARMICITAAMSVLLVAAGHGQDGGAVQELDAYVEQAVRDWRVPGLAIAVVAEGEVRFIKGYGVRERGRTAPVTTRTLFAIGSTTKAMTAAALGMLVDDGKLGWDDPVLDHLPTFRLHDPYVTRELTVRDLLTHRGGLGNADFLWYRADNSPDEIIRRLRHVRPAYSLRAGFVYQNIMYATAGAVIEAVSGMPWETFIRTRVFRPLGMDGSVPLLADVTGQPDYASPHYLIDDTVRVIENASVDPVAAAGSVWSSVEDMAKWMMFVLDSGRVNGEPLLSTATWTELLTPHVMVPPRQFYPTARLTRPHWTTYALGWFQHDYGGRAVSFHTGSIDGMVAIIGLIPDEHLGVYVLANLDHAEVRHALMYRVFDLFGPRAEATRDWSADLLDLYGELREEAEAARTARGNHRATDTQPSRPLDDYAGAYTDPLYGDVVISRTGDGLRLLVNGKLGGRLDHWHYDTFRVRWDHRWIEPSFMTFRLGSDGRPSAIERGGQRFHRVP